MGNIHSNRVMKEKIVDETVDRISELPDPILQKILSSVLSSDAARMSTLSKTWYRAWNSLPYLNFCGKFLDGEEENIKKFVNIVDQALANRQKQKDPIEKFSLHLTFTDHISSSYIRQWFRKIVLCNMKELILTVTSTVFETLPEAIFAAEELDVLELHGFKLELPYDGIMFSSLRKLKLYQAFTDDHFMRSLCASCTSLEDLTLDYCSGLTNLRIVGSIPKLSRVQLTCWCYEVETIDIIAPNLEILHLESYGFMRDEIVTIACRALKSLCLIRMGVTDQQLEDIFSSLPNLETLHLLFCRVMKTVKISSDRLKYIEIRNCSDLIAVELDTPNLTNFSYTALEVHQLPVVRLKASVFLKVVLTLSPGQELDSVWYANLVKFLRNLCECKAIKLVCDSEKTIVIPKHIRKDLVAPLYGTECLHIEYFKSFNKSVVDVLDSFLWMSPQLRTLSFVRDPVLTSTLKFTDKKYIEVEMDNFSLVEQWKLRYYLSHMKKKNSGYGGLFWLLLVLLPVLFLYGAALLHEYWKI